MSVLPQFLDHIHELGIYVDGYNYEEMYNIMVYNLTYNIISTNNFVYSYAQMNQLYNYLEDLLTHSEDSESDIEPETNPSINTNQDTIQLFNNYILTTLNNQYNQNLNQTNINNINNTNMNQTNMNQTNMNTNNEFTYTNLVYYNV